MRIADETTVEVAQPAPPPLAHAFAPGARVAGRYTIVRFIDAGGMGEVYEAVDEELGERIALKTVRRAIAAQPGAQRAFRREIHLARRVTHPGVCRMFDLGTDGTTCFLTMELLGGETLAARLEREGHLQPAEALRIARAIAAALDAAHRAGVVHGDLKPGNVMLVPTTGGEPRVVVTDFGLARLGQPREAMAVHSDAVRGSPAYLAPEVLDRPATPAADVFSLGVLLYRLLTGALPFPADGPEPAALIRRRRPPPPRAPGGPLPPRWDTAILRSLAARPEARHRSPAELVRALDRGVITCRAARAGAAVALAVAIVATWQVGRSGAAAVAPPRLSLAPLDGAALGDDAWVATALGERLAGDLATGDRGDGPRLAAGGAVTLDGDRVRLELALRDEAGRRPPITVVEWGGRDELGAIAGRAAAALRDRAGLVVSAAAPALPERPEAVEHYARGVELARRLECAAAIVELERAAALEPGFARTHAVLAEAHWFLGDAEAARTAARRALELAEGLGAHEQLLAEVRFWQTAGESGKAAALLERLLAEHPDDVEHAMALLVASLRSGEWGRARELVAALRRRQLGDDLRLDVAEMRVLSATGGDATPQAARLVAAGRARGARPMLVEGLAVLAHGRWCNGDLDGALAAYRERRDLSRALHDRNGELGSSFVMATILVDAGRLAEAERELGAPPDATTRRAELADHLDARARIALERGDRAGARAAYADELRAGFDGEWRRFREMRPALGRAALALLEGRLDVADREARLGREVAIEYGHAGMISFAQIALGDVAAARGDFAAAGALYDAARQSWVVRRIPLEVARVDLARSRAALAAGRRAEAEGLARAAAALLAPFAVPDDHALAAVAVAAALLAAGRRDEAREVLAPVLPREATTERMSVRLALRRAGARAWAGEADGARFARWTNRGAVRDPPRAPRGDNQP